MATPLNFLSLLTGCFAHPVAENPTVAMVEAAYRALGLDARYINCDVAPEQLADAVRGARAMGWRGFNCSLPHKVAVLEHIDALAARLDQNLAHRARLQDRLLDALQPQTAQAERPGRVKPRR